MSLQSLKDIVESKWTLARLYNVLRGKAVVLFGDPFIGKSYLCAKLCSAAKGVSGKPSLYIAIDQNLRTEYGETLKNMAKADWYSPMDPWEAYIYVKQLTPDKAERYSMIVFDSLTALQEYVIVTSRNELDPRVNLRLMRIATVITERLAMAAHTAKIPTILITHPTVIFGDQPSGPFHKRRPAFSMRAIKNVDLVLSLEMGEKAKLLRCVAYRSSDGRPPFTYIPVRELLGESKAKREKPKSTSHVL